MLPIRLNARRFPAELAFETTDAPDLISTDDLRTEPLIIEAPNLEDPVAMRLINCNNDVDLVVFANRFYDQSIVSLDALRKEQKELRHGVDLALSKHAAMAKHAPDRVNHLLGGVSLTPVVRMLDGVPRLVLEAANVSDFMKLEIATALEAGAKVKPCGHCEKRFLTGPFTGRQPHRKFCSDRCRVAFMRARKTEGADQ